MARVKTTQHSHRKPGKIKIVVIMSVLILIVFTIAVRPLSNYGHTDNKYEVLLMEESENKLILLLRNEGTLYGYYQDLIDEDSSLVGPCEVPTCLTAYIQDGMLETVYLEEYLTLKKLVPENGFLEAETQNRYFGGSFSEEDYFAFLSNGDLLVGQFGEPLQILDQYDLNDPIVIEDICNVEYMDTTPNGWVYVYSDEILYRWEGTDYESREAFISPCPEKLIGEEAFVGADGNIYVINGGELCQVPLEVDDDLDLYGSCGTDVDLYVPGASQTIYQFDWYGTLIKTFSTDADVLAVTPGYALIWKNSAFYLQRIDNDDEWKIPTDPDDEEDKEPSPPPEETINPTPTPTTTPTNAPTPVPTDDPAPNETVAPNEDDKEHEYPWYSLENLPIYDEVEGEEGRYIFLLAGTRAEDLRRIMKPQAIKITEENGSTVYAGYLKTGMKMDDYTIIIRGDCNGNGRVSAEDIYFIQECIVELRYIQTEAEFLAGDMDQDGKIGLLDCIMIVAEIQRNRNIFQSY